MELPTPQNAVAAVASFVRERLASVGDTVGDTLAPLLSRLEHASSSGDVESMRGAARNIATVIVAAATPFAQTSYARARLLRQLHASGLLTDDPSAAEQQRQRDVLGVAG